MSVRSRSRGAIENVDVAAATFVVGSDLQIADFLTVDDAILNLPVEGGTIFSLEGSFTVSTTIVLPDKPVKIIGSGIGATIFSMPTFAGPMFQVPDGLTDLRRYEFDEFSAVGGDVAGQEFLSLDDTNGRGNVFLYDVKISAIETPVHFTKYNEAYDRQTVVWFEAGCTVEPSDGATTTPELVKTPNPANSYFAPAAVKFSGCILYDVLLREAGAAWTCDADVDLLFVDSTFFYWEPGAFSCNGLTVRNSYPILLGNVVGDVNIYGNGWDTNDILGDMPVAGYNSSFSQRGHRIIYHSIGEWTNVYFFGQTRLRLESLSASWITACRFQGTAQVAALELNGCSDVVIEGCHFSGAPAVQSLLLADTSRTAITGCTFRSNITAKTIVETGTSDSNSVTGCVGINSGTGLTIIGPLTSIAGATLYDKATSSTNALVAVVPTITNPKGLQGVGWIKNTDGANSIDVKESFTDAFGTTSTLTTTVTFGNTLQLSLGIAIGTGLPPYVSYKVEVIDTVAGNHATYVSHFTAQGVI